MNIKRYAITVQHEVITYAYSIEQAKETACKAFAKATCVEAREMPSVETEALGHILIDHRTAPGS